MGERTSQRNTDTEKKLIRRRNKVVSVINTQQDKQLSPERIIKTKKEILDLEAKIRDSQEKEMREVERGAKTSIIKTANTSLALQKRNQQ